MTKVYDDPKTPYQRLIESTHLEDKELTKLQERFKILNPFELKKELDEKLKWFFRIAEARAKSLSQVG